MQQPTPRIGLVTVLYKSDTVLGDFVKSLAAQTGKNFVLFCVDNSPNEASSTLLHQLMNDYQIVYQHIKMEDNIGVAAGNNVGIRAAIENNCDYVLLLNNDIEFSQTHLFESLLRLAHTHKEKIFVPKILFYDTQKIWFGGGHFNSLRALGIHETGLLYETKQRHITYAPTCFMLIHKSVFEQIGIMDSNYFVYTDDTDFVYRATKQHLQLLYVPTLYLLHKVSSSTGGDNSTFYIYYSNRNKIYFIKKHYKGILKISSLGYFLFARILFYVKFNAPQRTALIKGIKDGFRMNVHNPQ